jgi:2-oxoglutarate ferredoxin oxidoreductase subunit delta
MIAQATQPTQPTPGAGRRSYGQVFLIEERCKGCDFCVEFCPKHILAMSDTFNSKGYHVPVLLTEGVCTDCKLCQLLCPEFAIYVIKTEGMKA